MKKINRFSILDKLPKIILATLTMSVAVFFLNSIHTSLALIIPTAIVFYFGILILLREKLFDDLKSALRAS